MFHFSLIPWLCSTFSSQVLIHTSAHTVHQSEQEQCHRKTSLVKLYRINRQQCFWFHHCHLGFYFAPVFFCYCCHCCCWLVVRISSVFLFHFETSFCFERQIRSPSCIHLENANSPDRIDFNCSAALSLCHSRRRSSKLLLHRRFVSTKQSITFTPPNKTQKHSLEHPGVCVCACVGAAS